jgi:hypothetical protein
MEVLNGRSIILMIMRELYLYCVSIYISLELLLLARLTQHDARDPLEFLVVDHQLRVQRVQLLSLLEVFSRLRIFLQRVYN